MMRHSQEKFFLLFFCGLILLLDILFLYLLLFYNEDFLCLLVLLRLHIDDLLIFLSLLLCSYNFLLTYFLPIVLLMSHFHQMIPLMVLCNHQKLMELLLLWICPIFLYMNLMFLNLFLLLLTFLFL